MSASTNLGPCCACGAKIRVRTIVMLDVKAPEPGKGWGCAQCSLPPDGAYAVLCDCCAERGKEPDRVVAGYPTEGRRVQRSTCGERHEHDMSKHPEAWEA